MLSRVSGFVREAVFAFYFGNSAVADAWGAAQRTPNVIQNLLGEGTLSASFIPVYAEFLEEGREEDAGRFAGAALGVLATVAYGLALIGMLVAPILVAVLFPRWEPWKQDLTVHLVRILFPMTATLAVSAWALGILNSHRQFFISYVAPVLWSLAQIAVLLTFGSWLGWKAAGREQDLIIAMGWGALAGGFLQLLVMLPWVLPVMHHFRLSVSRKVVGMREAISNFGPVVLARGVVNISGLLDFVLAGLLATGAVAMLRYAQQLYVLPISLFGMAIAASELPEMARKRGEADEVLRARIRSALERVAFLLVPSMLGYMVLGDVFVAGLLQRGEFDPVDTAAVYAVLAAYSMGVLASASSRALSSAYYALRDTRTPARIAVVRVAVSAAVGAGLMFPLDRIGLGELRLGAVGLALGAVVGSWLEFTLLRRKLRQRVGEHGPSTSYILRISAAGVCASVAGLGGKWLLGSAIPVREGWLHALLGPDSWLLWPGVAAGTAVIFGVTYLGAASALGIGVPVRALLRRRR
ncbi:MAG: murein biosynthesis integral membrane protein MurJ [Gemmatimonadetes bacterium]|nr:murein biosynthesis integral membrane protein MurJ [Gemmatimonadota bacterium]